MKHFLAILFLAVPLMAQFGGARRVVPKGATLPAKCSLGDLFQKTGTGAGLYNCYTDDNWVGTGLTALGAAPYPIVFAGETSRTVTAVTHGLGTTPGILWCYQTGTGYTAGYVWSYNGSGDLTINPAASAAYTGYCLAASGEGTTGPTGATGATGAAGAAGAAATIAVGTVTTGAAGSSAAVTNAGSSSAATLNFTIPKGDKGDTGDTGPVGSAVAVAVTASLSATLTHNFGSKDHLVGCFNASDVEVIPLAVTHGADADTITFDPAFTGRCVASTGGGGSGGAVASVFGRTGAVVAAANDYAFTDISGTLAVNKGGTGATTASGARVALLPSYTSNGSKCLALNSGATDTEWATCGSGGTVTAGAGLTGDGSSGDPIRIDPSGGGASQVLYSAAITGWATATAAGGATPCVEKNITATGAVAGESVAPIIPSTIPMGVSVNIYSATDLLVVRVCNHLGTTLTVADGLTFGGRIVRGF